MRATRAAVVPLFLLLAVARLPASAVSESQGAVRSLVDTGHVGAVLGLEYDDARGLLFSAGADGTVRIWDTAARSLVRVLEVTQLETQRLAVDPRDPRVAVVVTDGSGTYFISVWDWETERQVYRVPLDEEPLFLRFSGQGTYLLYGGSSWQGLHIVRSDDGTPVPFHPEGFGIVGFATMSRSERTLMTYLVRGRVQYWDMATGAQTFDAPSVPFLSGIRISRDQRYLAGSNGSEVVVVDAATGAARGRTALPGVQSLDVSAAGDIVSAATTQSGLATLSFGGDSLMPAAAARAPSISPSIVCSGSQGLYLGNASGVLEELAPDGAETPLTPDQLAGVTGFSPRPGFLALASRAYIRVFQSDLLSGSVAPSFLGTWVVANPFQAATRLSFLSDQRLLAWRTDTGGPGLAVVEPGSGGAAPAARLLLSAFRAPLVDLQPAGSLALGVETGGMIRLTDLATGVSRFDVRVPGADAAVQTSAAEFVAGRATTNSAEGSLMRVNISTGETVAVADRNVFAYSLLLAGGALPPALYSVGVDPNGTTSLLRHEGQGWDRVTVLDSVGEEDLNVSVALDQSSGRLYATLGVDRLVAGQGGAMQVLALENTAPRRLAAQSGLLFALTKAGSVSISNGMTGARLAEMYLFADGEWCVLFRDGRYAASPGGAVHVRVFANGAPVKATEDFRLRIGTP